MGFRHVLLIIGLLFTLSTAEAAAVFHDTQGDVITTQSLKGKWVIINYWAPWCSSCVREVPELNRFYEHNQDKNIAFYGVNFDQPPLADLKKAMNRVNIAYPVLVEDPSEAMKFADVNVLPTTFIVSPKGKVVGEIIGPSTEKYLQDYLHGLQTGTA